jgi:hypothetical protein
MRVVASAKNGRWMRLYYVLRTTTLALVIVSFLSNRR